MKKQIIVWVLLLVSFLSFGQNKKQPIADTATYTNYKLALRWMPMSLVDIVQPSLTLGAEVKFQHKYAIGLDVSTLIPYASLSSGLILNKGFIIKPSFRYYFPKNKKTGVCTFVEPDFFWKRQFNERSEWVAVYGASGSVDYNIRKDFTELKEVLGGNIKIGSQESILNDKVFLEIYIGIGTRTGIKSVWNSDNNFKPSETNNTIFNDELKYNQRIEKFSLTGGVRLVFAIKH